MGLHKTFCPVIAAQSRPIEHGLNDGSVASVRSQQDRSAINCDRWIFELDDDGTVIYSRPHILPDDGADGGIEGHNFFEVELGFIDIDRCRQHFRSFISSHKAAETFRWRCSSGEDTVDANVLMTRGFQTGGYDPTGFVMMEIRSC